MTRDAGHGADGVAKVSSVVDVKVRELRVRAVRVPMNPPHKTASGVVSESPLVLTDAVFDNGGVGHGRVCPPARDVARAAAGRDAEAGSRLRGDGVRRSETGVAWNEQAVAAFAV